MVRKILCATDLTEASDVAVRTALEMAHDLDATVTLLHVVEPAYSSRAMFAPFTAADQEFMSGIVRREQEAAIRLMTGQVANLNRPGRDAVTVTTTVRRGVPSDTICQTAREIDADLLVVGSHRRSGLSHALLGSVAERLVRIAPCEVLVAREKAS